MTDWHTLRHAYGDASDVPQLLEQLAPDPSASVWEELWSRLCHQGTVYSASFAALPTLLQWACTQTAAQRVAAIGLAAGIVGSQDVVDVPPESRQTKETVAEFEQVALETLAVRGLSPSDFIWVAEAVLAFRGDPVWGQQLNRLESGEFEGVCPSCGVELHLVVGEYGFFATPEEWVNRPSATRTPITQTPADSLGGVQRWLYDQAVAAQQPLVARWLLHLFGSTTCPSCGHGFSVPTSVERACGPTIA